MEISYYPFQTEDYRNEILKFTEKLKKHDELEVVVNPFSTQVYGQWQDLMKVIDNDLKEELTEGRSIAVIKLAGKDLREGQV